ncbi:hypothetical protein K443DRAFT_673702 [Laccaria amethystina LaAM-08-1]|uniref:HIG1 domain-containing protein n=1 Tax=Laccaria amethystina LaAM-08-1 TaxID=1095629 RepID=A0A0C9XZN9_9AGAR|nr:hypothetical protein K443DRAFT_673702 [Laccaria amethystina LaAM-08-1]
MTSNTIAQSPSAVHIPIGQAYEGWTEKFSRKFKENPWVPIGCVATCGALVMSAVKMRAGKSTDMNYWLRARVVLQGVTIAALVAGSMSLQAQRKKVEEATGVTEETKKEKEKGEFESRLRGAQAAYEEEAALAGKIVKGPTVRKHMHPESGAQEREEETIERKAAAIAGRQHPHPVAPVGKSKNGGWWWGWWESGSGSGSKSSS